MRLAMRFPVALLSLILLPTFGCSGDAPPEAQGTAEAPSTAAAPGLATATALGVANAHEPLPHLLTAGQLTEQQMDALAKAGYTNFISLRDASESGAGWEEAFASEHGLAFTRLAVAGAGDLTRDKVEALDGILDAAGDGPTVLYCGSSNRVGAMLALRAHWLDGMPAQEALDFGLSAGMTQLEPAVAQLLEREPAGR